MSPAPASDAARIRAAANRAWTAYRELWRKGRMGIAVALLIPCFACWLCSAAASGLGLLDPVPTATPGPTATRGATVTPRPSATARPTRTAAPPTATDEPATATTEPTRVPPTAVPVPTVVPPTLVPALPTEAPPPAAPQGIMSAPQEPAAPPPARRSGQPQGSDCPADLPVKGNRGSNGWIYHDQSSPNYGRTQPEECFATPEDAVAAGYRAPRR